MKKIIFTLFITILTTYQLFAENVTAESAYQVASSFVQSQSKLRTATSNNLTLAYMAQKEAGLRNTGTNYYYVFNVENDNGFVIISGDDVAKPILGYATSGKYDNDNLAPAFVYWMSMLQQEIDYAITNNITSTEKIQQSWDTHLSGKISQLRSTQAVEPLITTKWGQNAPYNLFTPIAPNSSNNCPTGCVATAMAQLMYYYKRPIKGTGVIPAYQTDSLKIDIPSFDLDNLAPYDWDKMADVYANDEAKEAVATLMRHCGASVEMDYLPSGSGAYNVYARDAMVTFFGYDKSMQAKFRLYYEQEWDDMLRSELNQNRPIYYAGSRPSGAHAFICDGYKDNDFFHFNWGWEGTSDGYYVTSATESEPILYPLEQMIITNIFPDAGGEETFEVKLKENTEIAFKTPVTSVAKGEVFEVIAAFSNAGANDFTGSYGAVLVNENDEIIESIGSADLPNNIDQYYFFNYTLSKGSAFSSAFTISCAISEDVAAGNYRIKAAVKPQQTGEWIIVNGQSDQPDYLDITLTDQQVTVGTDLYLYLYNHGGNDYSGAFNVSKLYPDEPGTFYFVISNEGEYDFFGTLELYIYSETGDLKQVIEKNNVLIDPNYYYPFQYSTLAIMVPEGKYRLRLYAKPAIGKQFLMPSYDEVAYQNDMKIIVGDDVGIANPTQQDEISIYPNPVNDQLFIYCDAKIYAVTIADITGKAIKQIATNTDAQISIPVNDLPTGNYLVLFQTDLGITVKKMIKL